MKVDVPTISAISMLVPFIIGCVRIRSLSTTYIPFLLLILAGVITELTCEIYIRNHRPYEEVLNVYLLIETFLITWQLKRWGLFRKNEWVFWTLLVFYVIAWSWESIYRDFSVYTNSYFTIAHSYIIAIMTITVINKLVIKVHGSLWKNPVFLICMGWLVYFTFSALAEAFFKYGLTEPIFAARIYGIVQYINIFTNIIFGIAILWIPSKPKFILPS